MRLAARRIHSYCGGPVPGGFGAIVGRIGAACLLAIALLSSVEAGPAVAAQSRGVSLPSVFFEAPGEVGRFTSWNAPVKMQLSAGNVVFLAGHSPIRLAFVGGHELVSPEGEDGLSNKFNFFRANAVSQAAAYTTVRYPRIYPGIDVVFHSGRESLKSEFQAGPGANPGSIRLRYEGAKVSLAERGDLRIQGQGAELREGSPVIFQMENGRRVPVEGKFRVEADGTVGFQIGAYKSALPLVIDPAITYSFVVNGNVDSEARAVVSDPQGNLYVAGWTDSVNFPTVGAEQPASGGGNDAFVFKLNPQGNALIYGTFLGGSGDDRAFGLAVDSSGEAVITGWTQSQNFPTYLAAQAASGGGQDAFVAKLNAAGNALVFSTFLGGNGSDVGYGVAVDGFGAIHVVGDTLSTNFPTQAAAQYASGGRQDAFFAEFGAGGNLLSSSYLGGNWDDHGAAVAVDGSGNTYLTGSTYSTNFPTALPFQAHSGGGQDAFVTKIGASGSVLLYSTYLGGSGGMPTAPEGGAAIAVDAQGFAYVAGTTSSTNFPTLNPLFAGHSYGTDAFLTKFDVTGGFLIYSTYIGGSSFDYGNAVAVDGGGNAYVAGMTSSWDFPVVNPVQAAIAGDYDGFVVKINGAGTLETFGTWIGGSFVDSANGMALDHLGNLYLAGQTSSLDFPAIGGIPGQALGGIAAFLVNTSGPGDHTPFLDKMYLGFFDGPPDPVGFAFWSAGLDAGPPGPAGEAVVAWDFMNSTEFSLYDEAIATAYLGVVGTDVTFTEFTSALAQFRSGAWASPSCLAGPAPYNTVPLCSQLTLIQANMTSPQYQFIYGSLSDSQFVTALFLNLFGTAPSAPQLSALVSQLNAGLTRAQLIQYVLNNPLYIGLEYNRILVDTAYMSILFRDPDPGGFQYWLSLLNAGLSQESFLSYFLMSGEFQGSL